MLLSCTHPLYVSHLWYYGEEDNHPACVPGSEGRRCEMLDVKLHLRSDRPIPGLAEDGNASVVTITYTFVLFCKAFKVLSKASSYLMLTVLRGERGS